jgi:hypothetical protein
MAADNVVRWHDRYDTLARWSPEAKHERMKSAQIIKELEHQVFLSLDNAPSEYCSTEVEPSKT